MHAGVRGEAHAHRCGLKDGAMLDLVYLALGFGAFALFAGFAVALRRL